MIPLFVAVMLFIGAPAQSGGDAGRTGQTSKAERLERWRSLDAASRAELTRRYETLKAMSAADRAKLVQRGERLQREIDVTLRSLGPEERAAIEALEPRERRRVLRGLIGDRARSSAAQLRSRMTKKQREALESAGPKERAAILHQVREQGQSRMSERISMLGRNLGLSESEIRRIERGSKEERREMMIKVVRRRSDRYVKEHGLPSSMTPEGWRSITESDDDEFVRGYLRLRFRHPEFGVPPKQWDKRKKQGASMASRLEAFSKPTTRQRARSPRTTEAQLRQRTLLGQRAEVEKALVRMGDLSGDEAARLRALDDEAFVRMVRHTVMTLRRGGDLRSGVLRGTMNRDRGERGSGDGRSERGAHRNGVTRDRPSIRQDPRRRQR